MIQGLGLRCHPRGYDHCGTYGCRVWHGLGYGGADEGRGFSGWKNAFQASLAEIQVCFFRIISRRGFHTKKYLLGRAFQMYVFGEILSPWSCPFRNYVTTSLACCLKFRNLWIMQLESIGGFANAFAFGWQFNHNVSGWIHGPEEVTVWFSKHWKIGKWWTCKLVNRELISPNKLPSTICWNSDGICGQNLQICCQWRCGLQSFARRTGNITLADRLRWEFVVSIFPKRQESFLHDFVLRNNILLVLCRWLHEESVSSKLAKNMAISFAQQIDLMLCRSKPRKLGFETNRSIFSDQRLVGGFPSCED